MQSLSVSPLTTDCLLNFEPRRKTRNPRGFSTGFVCRSSRVHLYAFWGFKHNSIASSVVPLALAFEEQVVVGKIDSNPVDESNQEDVGEVLDDIHSDRVKLDDNLPPESTKVNGENRGENRGENSGENRGERVDTRVLASSLRAAETANDVELVLGDKGDLPLQVYSTIIRAFGKDKRVNAAIALVEWLKLKTPGPNLFIYNSLLGAIKQAGQFDHVDRIMNDMVNNGISPNVVTYNTLMGIALAQGDETKAIEIFNAIKTKGLSPSPASYSTALLAYRRMEDGFGALDFYIKFRNSYRNGEITRNNKNDDWETEANKLEDFVVRICYQVMRRWLVNSSSDSSHNVLRLLTCMDQAGLPTGRSEHERLIWACTRADHHTVAKELYNRLRENGSDISLSVCNHVIWLLGKAKKWWAALEIYEDLLDKGPKPNNMSYELIVSHFNFLLTAARRKGIWRWGIRLLDKMQEKGLKPGAKEWNSVLIACSKASEPSMAIQIFNRMIENGEKPTIISYGALLSVLEKSKLYNEAIRVWDHMMKLKVEPNAYAYTIMASVYAAQGKFNIVESIVREMVICKVELTVVTFNAIISACGRNNDGGGAYEWFQRMEVEKIEANEVSYEMLIEALVNDGKTKVAYDMVLRAQGKGLRLSEKAYDAVVRAAVRGGATVDLSLLRTPTPAPVPESKKSTVFDVNHEDMGIIDE